MSSDEPSTLHPAHLDIHQPMDVVVAASSSCAPTLVPAPGTLKRAASPAAHERDEGPTRKRLREDIDREPKAEEEEQRLYDSMLASELSEELQCGCCSELVYRPVLVMPCQHFFCGSCCTLWIRNGGTNCPACRGRSDAVVPFRALQSVADMLVRLAPEKARTERERQQADEVYVSGSSLSIPSPKERSPEPQINHELVYPCPTCAPNNAHGWRCPRAIPDPVGDPDNAWRADEGNPPGHASCGHCEQWFGVDFPLSTKCDFCQLQFCGIHIPERCRAMGVLNQHPQGFENISHLIESSEIYDSFEGNTYEVELVFDYLRRHDITPRHIYRSIVAYMQQNPRQFQQLVESEVFSEIHLGGPVPEGPFERICRACASDVLLWGLKDWWIRERRKGLLDDAVLRRPDCADGSECPRQKDTAHAREFNHLIAPPQEGPCIPVGQLAVQPASANVAPVPGPAVPAPLAATESMDVVASMVVPPTLSTPTQTQSVATSSSQTLNFATTSTQPQTQPTASGSSQTPNALRTMSTLSFLLNASEADEATAMPTIAQVLQSSSASDIRGALDAFIS